MLTSLLSPFLDTYSLSTSFLGYKALYIVLSFLVLWSICLSSSIVHFKNGPEYLTPGITQVFIPLMRFLLYSLVSNSFLVLPLLPIFPRISTLPFLRAFWFFLDSVIQFLRPFVVFCFSLLVWYISLCQIPLLLLLLFSPWSLSDSKSPQVSRTLLSILAVLSNAVIWIVSHRLLTSKSSRPFNNPLVIMPKAPITIGTIVTFMVHSFFNSLARSMYLSFFLHSFSFILWSAGTAKLTTYYHYYYYSKYFQLFFLFLVTF